MLIGEFVERALGTPFVVGGRSYDGWDCWGLVFVAYRDVFRQMINSLSGEYDEKLSYAEVNRLVDREKEEWRRVQIPTVGDIGLYRVSRYQTHVSLVLDRGMMIHCEQTAGTLVERISTLVWAKRHVGYYRRTG